MVLFPRHHTEVKYGDFTIRRLRPNLEFNHTSIDGTWKFITNSQGYRSDYDFSYNKPENSIRILCLGDSHTQGFEVRQNFTYSAIIEKYLIGQGYDSEVYNMGISGYSNAEELVLLENEGVNYKPDYVILGFYANDFEDNIKTDLFEIERDVLNVKKKSHIPGVRVQNFIYSIPFVQFFSENSYFYSLLFNETWEFFKRKLLSQKNKQLVTEYAIPTEEVDDYKILFCSLIIQRIYSICKNNGIKLIILDIPQLSNEDFKSSIPDSFIQTIQDNSDITILSDNVLNSYRKMGLVHLPHGHRHISEFTHAQLGVAVAKEILADIR